MDTVEALHAYDRATYRITVQGVLDERWSDWLEGMRIESAVEVGRTGQTVLEGALADQSSLLGVLGVLHGLGLSVIRVEYLGQHSCAVRQREES